MNFVIADETVPIALLAAPPLPLEPHPNRIPGSNMRILGDVVGNKVEP
jgi:hypothetical protein